MSHSEFITGCLAIWPPPAWTLFIKKKDDLSFWLGRQGICSYVMYMLVLSLSVGPYNHQVQSIAPKALLTEAANRCGSLQSSFWALLP